ncbi:N-acetylmuramoyl-L-alanine amidase [Flavobacterium sp.]|uniref:N-acetylmuramoyl-L-alanine amidase n=1 Tax=Flavobacterium sp. TaxID=239 RepID=UPI00263A1309|nr:N-acetylmuramoyl-L-alanine amidase [Flavobacterium sp.]
MRTAKGIKYIAIHCSAGFGTLDSIRAFWKSKGWRSPGYHILIDTDGTIHYLLDFSKTSNGVLGFNLETINICYKGGVENIGTLREPIWKAKDTRTEAQKAALETCIEEAKKWLQKNKNTNKIIIQGHRDFSPDKNKNGIIESWERIKECPSFDAKKEYNEKI